MSARKAGPWHTDITGNHVRMFEPDGHGRSYAAAHIVGNSWSAFKVPFPASIETARGCAESIDDAMAKADAQIRAWAIEVVT